MLDIEGHDNMSSTQWHTATLAFQRVELDASFHSDNHALSWWRSSGYALSVLLDKAGYPDHAQYQLLKFIRTVTFSLGSAHLPGNQHWKSFMTDDHTPIEVSWDWRTGETLPKIRFSIEPIGPHAGTSLDPDNKEAASRLLDTMAHVLPATHMKWLTHFRQRLTGTEATGSPEGHSSKEFYAFDLGEDDIITKAYFFPGFKAKITGQTNVDVILETICSAPLSTPEKLEAFKIFLDYVHDPKTPPLEIDMVAIDVLHPAESRFKIYFRIRDSSFTSIQETMTLGNRLSQPGMGSGLQNLRQLYNNILERDTKELTDSASPPNNGHRTAGILYNIDFKYGSKTPKVKAYFPVRHWAKNEEVIISALETHFFRTQPTKFLRYKDAVYTIL